MAGQAKEKSKGGFLGNIGNSLFRQVKDVVIDLQSGSMGVKQKNDEGEFLVTLSDEQKLIHNPIKQLGLPIPGIAIRTNVADLKVGDIIVMPDGGYSFNLGPAGDGDLNIVNAKSGRSTKFNPAQNTILGNNGVMAVRNLFNFGGGGGAGGGLGGNPLLLMLLLGNKDGEDGDSGFGGIDKKTLMLLMLSGGLGGQQAPASGGGCAGGLLGNPLLLMLLLGDKDGEDGDSDDLFSGGGLKTLLMMQMLGGGGAGLGAAALFGGLGGGSTKACCKTAKPAE